MAWLFALGIIYFALVHRGFRKIVLSLLGVAAAVVIISLIVNY